METIMAKQVDGAIDNSTDQSIAGVKSFMSPVNFFPFNGAQFECMRMDGLYLYWLLDQSLLDSEGNLRLGPSQALPCITFQKYTDGKWQEYHPGEIFY